MTRDEVFDKLRDNGIIARSISIHLRIVFNAIGSYTMGGTPVAKHISERVLTLPLYSDLPLE